MKNSIDFFNEKGNVRAKVRSQYKTLIMEKFKGLFDPSVTVTANVNGGVSVLLGYDKTTEEPIWAHMSLKINTKSPNIDEYTGIEIKKDNNLPQLF